MTESVGFGLHLDGPGEGGARGGAGDAARLRVAAPPADGKANAAALAFLASVLGLRRRDLVIVPGLRGRDKTVRVSGLDARSVADRLSASSG